MTLADLRTDYQLASLSEDQIDADPITQFSIWFQEALDANMPEPNTMTLSTANTSGRPSSRIVLVKEFDQRGFSWFTHYTSRKGNELARNPQAALLFYWIGMERQVRIEGRVEKVSVEESENYFNSRPLSSRHGAIASEQSEIISSRAQLDLRVEKIAANFGENVTRPLHWGGYRLVPDYFEFWQGRSSRLHDRIAYSKNADGSWLQSRLQP